MTRHDLDMTYKKIFSYHDTADDNDNYERLTVDSNDNKIRFNDNTNMFYH